VAELTGLFGVDWATVALILFGVAIAAMSLRRDVGRLRAGPFLIVPLTAGILLVLAIWTMQAENISRFLPLLVRPIDLVFVLAVSVVAVALADLLFTRVLGSAIRVLHRDPRGWAADLVMAILVGGTALVGVATMNRLSDAVYIERAFGGLDARLEVDSVYPLPAIPLDVELRSERDGYISLGTRIVHFELPDNDGSDLALRTVADGFTYTRGITIVGDVLIVADLGSLPCPDPFPVCKGDNVPNVGVVEGDRKILESSRGRLLAFDIEPDGSLSHERVILDDLPVANTEHGLNDVTTGPDGAIYVSIGNLDHLSPEIAETIHRPNMDLLGTVLRLSPDGRDVTVFARGLRNVYGLTFDDRGGLWGVDNDGATPQGWRGEEILHIRRGRNYGYPYEGSFGNLTVRNDFAVWFAEGFGSAGVLWAGDVGLGPGLLIGSFDRIDGLRLTDMDTGWAVASRGAYAELMQVPGFVSHLEPLGHDRILATVGTFYGDTGNALYVLSVEH
jgi:Glucose / Sorbosone dehydrogenase